MISVVLVTLNSEKVLKACLDSLKPISNEIVIVDLGSEDETQNIAKQFNTKFFTHEKVDFVEKVRNFAVEKATGDWILVLDPDERVRADLWRKLKSISEQGKYTAVNIPRKNIFFGKWIAHTNWWPDKHVRFFKKGTVSWSEKIHQYPKVNGKILNLPSKEELAIEHFGYSSVEEFIERQSRYAGVLAENLFEEGVRFSWGSFFWNPTREFLVRFIKYRGFLDGFLGFVLTYLMMVYQLQVQVKLWELENIK